MDCGTTDRDSRTCTRCLVLKPQACFFRKGSRWDSRCKECVLVGKKSAYRKQRKAKNRSTTTTVTKFDVVFAGEPDLRLLAHRLTDFVKEE